MSNATNTGVSLLETTRKLFYALRSSVAGNHIKLSEEQQQRFFSRSRLAIDAVQDLIEILESCD